jgi:quinol monooxygenase YgiN
MGRGMKDGPKANRGMFMELTIKIRSNPEKRQELYQALQELLPTIRNERGCLDCRIFSDVEEGQIFFLSVHWEARANLENYLRACSGIALLGAIELLGESAAFRTGHDAPWEGIDALKMVRKKRNSMPG